MRSRRQTTRFSLRIRPTSAWPQTSSDSSVLNARVGIVFCVEKSLLTKIYKVLVTSDQTFTFIDNEVVNTMVTVQ